MNSVPPMHWYPSSTFKQSFEHPGRSFPGSQISGGISLPSLQIGVQIEASVGEPSVQVKPSLGPEQSLIHPLRDEVEGFYESPSSHFSGENTFPSPHERVQMLLIQE